MSVQDVLARLGTARLLLEEVAEKPTQRITVSAVQAQAAMQLIQKLPPMDSQVVADISAAVLRAKFVEADEAKLQDILLSHGRPQKQWCMQSYEAVVDYFTEHEWKLLTNENVPFGPKQRMLIDRTIELGCQRPSESTVKRCVALLTLLKDGTIAKLVLGTEQMKVQMQNFRQEFKKTLKVPGTEAVTPYDRGHAAR